MWRSNGIITVGPVITINAENIIDSSVETPNIWCVAKYINVIVMIGAIKTNRNNDDPIFFKSRIRKFKPPSKTITLTKSDTSGYKISPKTASVSSTENTGPTKKPNNNNTIMDGNRVRHAIH